MMTDFIPDTAPSLPSASQSSHEKLTQKIQNLNGNIEQVGAKVKEINGQSGESSSAGNTSSETPPSSQDQNNTTLPSQELALSKPREDEEIVPFDNQQSDSNKTPNPQPSTDPRKLPRLESKNLGTLVIENVDRQPPPYASVNNPPLRTPNQGQRQNRLDAITPSMDGSILEPRALDGSKLKSYEVEQLPTAVFYRTLVVTNVLSAPSVLSESVTRLEPNTKVRVVARMGQWLELKSSEGRRGFIYAQDAVEVKETASQP